MTPQEEEKYEKRFDRIEDKLDKLVEIVTSLARVEEQMAHNNKRLDYIETRVTRVEEQARSNSTTVNFANKLFWVGISSIVGIVAYVIQRGI